jgi:hypothetical protein
VDVDVRPATREEQPLVEQEGIRISVPGRAQGGGPNTMPSPAPAGVSSSGPANSSEPAVLVPLSEPGATPGSRPPPVVASNQSFDDTSEEDNGHVVEEETAIMLGGSSPHAAHLARDYHRSELHDTRGLSLNNNNNSSSQGLPLDQANRDNDTTQQQLSQSDPKGVDAAAPEGSSSDTPKDTSALASYGLGGALASAAAAAATAPANAVRSALRVAQGYFTGSANNSRDDSNDNTEEASAGPQPQQPPPSPKPVNVGDVKAAARAAEATMSGRSSYADLSELAGNGGRSGAVTPTHAAARSPRVSELGSHRETQPTVVVTGGQNVVVAGGPGVLAPEGPAMAAGAGPGVIAQVRNELSHTG